MNGHLAQGTDLARVKQPSNPISAAGEWTLAVMMAYLLLPIHALAEKVVYSKIRAAIGIKQVWGRLFLLLFTCRAELHILFGAASVYFVGLAGG